MGGQSNSRFPTTQLSHNEVKTASNWKMMRGQRNPHHLERRSHMVSSHLPRTALGLLALLLAGAAAEPAAAQTTLRYKFKKGEKLNYVMEQKMKMAMNLAGQDIETEMGQTIDMSW